MKRMTKIKEFAFIIAITITIVPKINAQLDFWRPNKQSGLEIEYHQCVYINPLHCATVYEEGSDELLAILYGQFIPNPQNFSGTAEHL